MQFLKKKYLYYTFNEYRDYIIIIKYNDYI